MKKTTGRATSNTTSFSTRFAAYSATAGAAMLVAPGANAAITNITSLTLNGTSVPSVDVNFSHGGANFTVGAGPVQLHFTASNSYTSFFGGRGHIRGAGPFAFTTGNANINVENLDAGHAFAGLAFDPNTGRNLMIAKSSGFGPFGAFAPNGGSTKTGYAALKIGSTYLWLRLKVSNGDGRPTEFALLPSKNNPAVFGAYDQAGSAVTDGFTVGSIAAVPEPSAAALTGLGLLALGATGIREMRRRKAAGLEN